MRMLPGVVLSGLRAFLGRTPDGVAAARNGTGVPALDQRGSLRRPPPPPASILSELQLRSKSAGLPTVAKLPSLA